MNTIKRNIDIDRSTPVKHQIRENEVKNRGFTKIPDNTNSNENGDDIMYSTTVSFYSMYCIC